MGIHDGHRDRLRERFRKEGLDHFNEINVLELLLFHTIPRQDTNELAHRLLEQFGSLEKVLDANVEELEKIKGISFNSATFLSLISAVSRYYTSQKTDLGEPLNTVEAYCALLEPYFMGRRNEMVYLLCLDAKCKKLCCTFLGEGSINSANVPARKVVEAALSSNATMVVLAHNHPGGVAFPSPEDEQVTRHLSQILRAMDVVLLDHVIVSDGQSLSMAQSGYYRPVL